MTILPAVPLDDPQVRLAARIAYYRRYPEAFFRDQLRIRTKDGTVVPLHLWPCQRPVMDLMMEQRKKHGWVRLVTLKARQVGLSTLSEAYISNLVMLNPNTNGLIIAHDSATAETLYSISRMFYDNLDPDIKPMKRYSTKKELLLENPDDNLRPENPGLGSRLVITSANNIHSGIGRTLRAVHVCIAPSTVLWTDRGMLAASELRVGDRVITGLGHPAAVSRIVSNPPDDRPWVRVHMWGTPSHPLWVTADHQLLTTQGWKPAGALNPRRDLLLLPVRRSSETLTEIDLSPYYADRWHPGRRRMYRRAQPQTTIFPLTAETGWFLGLFLAEGSCKTRLGYVCGFSLALERAELDLAERAMKIVAPWTSSTRTYCAPNAPNRRVVDCFGTGFAQFLADSCYLDPTVHRAHTKTLPPWIYQAPLEFLHGVVQGYIVGDGHLPQVKAASKQRRVTACSVSSSLIAGIRDLLMTLGYGWPGIRFEPANQKNNRNARDIWTLYINGDQGRRLAFECFGRAWDPVPTTERKQRWRDHYPNHLAVRIRRVEPAPNSDMIDIEVDDLHHSFRCVQAVAKNSECARYVNPEGIIDGVFPALAKKPGTACILESTAQYSGMWFKEMCERAKRRDGDYWFVFVPWYLQPDYRVPLLPGEVLALTAEEKRMVKYFGLTMEQIKFFRQELATVGSEALFQQSYPLTEEQAWITPGDQVFPYDKLEFQRREHVRPPIRIAEVFPGPRILDQPAGRLHLWEEPQPGVAYDIGVDVALGADETDHAESDRDWSVMCVIKRGSNEQVAEWRSRSIDVLDLATIAYWLGHYYNTAQIAVEVNGVGIATNMHLAKMSYGAIYQWRYRDEMATRLTKKIGWETNFRTKRWLISFAVHQISNNHVIIRSERLINELRNYVHLGNDRYGGAAGSHDDVAMAYMIALTISDDENFEKWTGMGRSRTDRAVQDDPRLLGLEPYNHDPLLLPSRAEREHEAWA